MSPDPETAATAFTRSGQNAVTHAHRITSTALARAEQHRDENAKLIRMFGRKRLAGPATEPTPGPLKAAARRFRAARGLPVADLPPADELVPPVPEPPVRIPRPGDDDEDFSQTQYLKREP